MIYPSALDYKSAILAPDKFLLDPVLQQAKPIMRRGTSIEPFQISGGFARVYKFADATGKAYAFRCWSADIGDTAKIYLGITDCLKTLRAPCFIDFQFSSQAILVNGAKYPGMRMDWIEAPSLQNFAHDHVNDAALLESCAHAFLEVARFLHSVHVSHGDLQGDNIKVRSNNGRAEILLIDYDTMHVPALAGRAAISSGLASYQHPKRDMSKQITEKDDYFSELVIYIALIALARCRSIREAFARVTPDKDFLFKAEDFKSPLQSLLIHQLRREGDREINELAKALVQACQMPSIDQLRPLEEIVDLARGRSAGEPVLEPSVFAIANLEARSSVSPDPRGAVLLADQARSEEGVSVFTSSAPSPAQAPQVISVLGPAPPAPRRPLREWLSIVWGGVSAALGWLMLAAIASVILTGIWHAISSHTDSPPTQSEPTQAPADAPSEQSTPSAPAQGVPAATPTDTQPAQGEPATAPTDTQPAQSAQTDVWDLRRDSTTNICSVLPANDPGQADNFLTAESTRAASCQDAQSHHTANSDGSVDCPSYTDATRETCAAEGVDLPAVQ